MNEKITKVFKYVLKKDFYGELQKLTIPETARFLDGQLQGEEITLWYEVVENEKLFDRYFRVYGTGNTTIGVSKFLATIQFKGNVYHVFHDYQETIKRNKEK